MEANKRIAIVTGGNKGIGLEICRQLASNGVYVILTARDEKRGKDAVEKLTRDYGLTNIMFHQLDVTDPLSIASLAGFIQNQFGKLDILINNAGVLGFESRSPDTLAEGDLNGFLASMVETFEKGKECIDINYYGTKRMCETFIPLLQLSLSPRIANVSSSYGRLNLIPGESIRKELGNVNQLTESRLDELLNTFLDDFKEGRLKEIGWPDSASAYKMSKAMVSAYTRLIAKGYPEIVANCVCPGYVKTDLNYNTGIFSVEEGAKGPVMLALLPDASPSGQFYHQTEPSSFE